MYKERIKAFLAKAEAAREKLEDDMPSALVIETALRGMLNSRTGRKLARAKTFRENPLGSLLHRLVSWHGSGGGLWCKEMRGCLLSSTRKRWERIGRTRKARWRNITSWLVTWMAVNCTSNCSR